MSDERFLGGSGLHYEVEISRTVLTHTFEVDGIGVGGLSHLRGISAVKQRGALRDILGFGALSLSAKKRFTRRHHVETW